MLGSGEEKKKLTMSNAFLYVQHKGKENSKSTQEFRGVRTQQLETQSEGR